MVQHLLVPIDGSGLSERAADASAELACKVGARITGFVVEPLSGSRTKKLPARTTLPLLVLH